MNSIAQPLTRLVEAMQWFVIARELRLLHVTTSPSLRLAALEHIAAAEHHGDNHAPFFVLETPTSRRDDGWEGRAEELHADYAELHTLLAEANEGISLPRVWAPPRARSPRVRFGLEVGEALRRLTSPFDGLVLVLAPLEVQQPKRWVADLQVLLTLPELKKARFIVVETDGAHCAQLAKALGKQAERVDASVEEKAAREDMARMLASMASAPPGATGAWLTGAAGPRVAPPPRPGEARPLSTPQREELARQMNVAPALLDPEFQRTLRHKVFSAAHALREGKPVQAVQEQREARDLCLAAGLDREAVSLELVLGGYVLQAGQHAQALEIFRDARLRAEAHQLRVMAVQAQLAQASTLLVLQRTEDATLAYAEAGRLGMETPFPVLGIEGYRMCGQLLASAGKLSEAATAWRLALEAANKAPPDERRATSAPEAARQLAALCREQGLKTQAESLEAQAAWLETPSPARAQEA
jgi:tetratricopeptide (TPR) repeat protein